MYVFVNVSSNSNLHVSSNSLDKPVRPRRAVAADGDKPTGWHQLGGREALRASHRLHDDARPAADEVAATRRFLAEHWLDVERLRAG